jgi:hypothetical protein
LFIIDNISNGLFIPGKPGPASNQYAVNEIITKPYSQNYGKMGYVDDDLTLHEYPESMMPTYTKQANITFVGSTPIGSSTNITNIQQCQVKCSGDASCNYFENSDDNCYYYNTVGITGPSSGDIYIKNDPLEKTDPNNCPYQNIFDNISTSDWEFYAKGEIMNPDFSCETRKPNYLNKQIDNVNQINTMNVNELTTQTENTNTLLDIWNKSSNDILKTTANEKKINSKINNIMGKNISYKEGFNIATLVSMESESKTLRARNLNRIIFWSLIAITFLLMVLRIIKLYSK